MKIKKLHTFKRMVFALYLFSSFLCLGQLNSINNLNIKEKKSRLYEVHLDFSIGNSKLVNKIKSGIPNEKLTHHNRLDKGTQYAVNLKFKRKNIISYGILYSFTQGQKSTIYNIEEQVLTKYIGPILAFDFSNFTKRIYYTMTFSLGNLDYTINAENNSFETKFETNALARIINFETLYKLTEGILVGLQMNNRVAQIQFAELTPDFTYSKRSYYEPIFSFGIGIITRIEL